MNDKERFISERDTAAIQLALKASNFESGFKNVSSHDPNSHVSLVFVPVARANGVVRTAEHREMIGEGTTSQEAMDDWSTKLARLPQSGDRLFWRCRPEIDWMVDRRDGRILWRVYARLAIFETNEAAA